VTQDPGPLEQLGELHVHARQGDLDVAALQLADQLPHGADRGRVGVHHRLAVEQHPTHLTAGSDVVVDRLEDPGSEVLGVGEEQG
jgi:hypothetical protein